MSIKKKKRIHVSNNAYRWERIEEYLILQGYILIDSSRSLRVWVDCVSHGRNIQYNLESVKWQLKITQEDRALRRALLRTGLPLPEGEFEVMCKQGESGKRIYKSVRTISQAVIYSREKGGWDS